MELKVVHYKNVKDSRQKPRVTFKEKMNTPGKRGTTGKNRSTLS